MSGSIPFPEHCSLCELDDAPAGHWTWAKDARYTAGGRWRCREGKRARGRESLARMRRDPVRGPELREYAARYAKEHARWARYKAYRHIDNKRYGGGTIPWEDADVLMGDACAYCGVGPAEGLDRRDNARGHALDNVTPCCVVCNHILGDIPAEVKDMLAAGLRQAREKGLLDTWIPPQFRK